MDTTESKGEMDISDLNVKISLASLCDTGRTMIEEQVKAGLIEPMNFFEHSQACPTCSSQWDQWIQQAMEMLPKLLPMLMGMR